jgi:NADPH-dependent 2,4-dienoyl-CoA reductase/sulfur reductase-like enzyme
MAVSRAWNVDSAEEVKKAVKIPVMAVGRIYDPIVAEMVLASGKADLVVMGRGSLADPALPKKAQAGEFDKIRECIGCLQGCIGKLLAGFPIACLVNPQLGFEYQAIGKTDKPKRVCVAGGGPAGIEAARGAAMRGHDVTVFEQSDRLGGAFGVAAYPPYKGDIASYISWARSELAGLGVHVRVGEKATADIFRSEKFDVVIVATGAKSFVPDSIKADAGLVDARDLIAGKTGEPGQNCVVLGGGLIGVEAAVHLGWLGRHVTMLEMRDKIAADIEGGVLPSLLELVERYGIKAITGAVINEVADGSVMYEHEGQRHQIKADTVVSALGLKPDNALADELSGWGKVVVVGDASVPQKAIEAIRGGFLAGISI